MSINKNNKNFQITLDPDSAKILESLAVRFKTSKSIIIRNALKVYSSKKLHHIKITFSTLQEVEQTELKPSKVEPMNQEDNEAWERTLQELENIK